MIKKISLALLIILYIGAGINHFWHPQGYLTIIPPYLPAHELINILAGIAEICLGILLIFPTTRKFAAYGIVLMLIAFIPAHIYMIQIGGCAGKEICIPLWAAWFRLIPLQFILMWWAWWHRK
jgi:uncharacterized membrane protein